MPEDPPVIDGQIRWVWAYDRNGARASEFETIIFKICDDPRCGNMHPMPRVSVEFKPLPGFTVGDFVGHTSCIFPLDD